MDTEVASDRPITESEGMLPEEEDCYQIDPTAPTKKMQRTDKLSIPELLALRQEFGISSLSLPPFSRPRHLLTATLSSKIAWYVLYYSTVKLVFLMREFSQFCTLLSA